MEKEVYFLNEFIYPAQRKIYNKYKDHTIFKHLHNFEEFQDFCKYQEFTFRDDSFELTEK